MVGGPKYLTANCLAPVVFRDTQSRFSFLGGCLGKKGIYCAVKGKFLGHWMRQPVWKEG